MDQNLTSMKMDKKEMKDTVAPEVAGSSPKGPRFPWGLEVTLEEDSLQKLDVNLSEFPYGQEVEIYARAKMIRKEESEGEGPDGKKRMNRTMKLQITDMCLEATDAEAKSEKEMNDDMGWDDDQADVKLKKKGY